MKLSNIGLALVLAGIGTVQQVKSATAADFNFSYKEEKR